MPRARRSGRDAGAARETLVAVQALTRALELLGGVLSGLGNFAGTGNPHGGRKSAGPGASPIPDSVASDPPTAARKSRERRARALARKEEAEGRAAAAKQGPTEDAAHQPSTHASRAPRGVAARQNRSGSSGGSSGSSSGGSSGGATAAEKSAEGKAAAATPGPTGEAAHRPSTHARRDPPGQTGGSRLGSSAAAARRRRRRQPVTRDRLRLARARLYAARRHRRSSPGVNRPCTNRPPHLPKLALAP